MSEVNPAAGGEAVSPDGVGGRSAGQMLREAREAQRIEIDALASTMKVAVQKLELLESDRHDELPGAAFARALAQAVCRTLKIDPTPVLEQLPRASDVQFEHVSPGLNEPFRDHPLQLNPVAWFAGLRSLWAPALLLVLAGAIYFVPLGFLRSTVSTVGNAVEAVRSSVSSDSDSAVVMPPTEIVVQDGVAMVPAADGSRSAIAAASNAQPTAAPFGSMPAPVSVAPGVPLTRAAPGAGTVELRASAESWVEVKDGQNRVLLARSLHPDETVMLDGAMPLRVKIGNAAVTELRYRGELIDLEPMTSENIARVQLK